MTRRSEIDLTSPAIRVSTAELHGHTCVVTGASSGIGRAIAVALASAGATVCAVARRRAELEATANRVNGAGRFAIHPADLLDDEQVASLAETLLAREGGVDVLVHSAGTISLGDFETGSVRDLDRQYAANVRAPYLLTQALLPALRANGGQIVFINSTVGLTARATAIALPIPLLAPVTTQVWSWSSELLIAVAAAVEIWQLR